MVHCGLCKTKKGGGLRASLLIKLLSEFPPLDFHCPPSGAWSSCLAELEKQNQKLEGDLKSGTKSGGQVANKRSEALRLEVEVLSEENRRLKEMIRAAEESVTGMLERQSSAPEGQEGDSSPKPNGAPRQVVGLLCEEVSSLGVAEEKAGKAHSKKNSKHVG